MSNSLDSAGVAMPVAQIDGATWRKFYDDIGLHIRETLTVAEDSTGTTLLELTTLASALRLVRGQVDKL